jgi:hypothetical protein
MSLPLQGATMSSKDDGVLITPIPADPAVFSTNPLALVHVDVARDKSADVLLKAFTRINANAYAR